MTQDRKNKTIKIPKPETFQITNQFIDSTSPFRVTLQDLGKSSVLNIGNYGGTNLFGSGEITSITNLATNTSTAYLSAIPKPETFQITNQFIDSTSPFRVTLQDLGKSSVLNIGNYGGTNLFGSGEITSITNLATNTSTAYLSAIPKPETFQITNQFIDSTSPFRVTLQDLGKSSVLNIGNYGGTGTILSNTVELGRSNLGSRLNLDLESQKNLSDSFAHLSTSYQGLIRATGNQGGITAELNKLSGIEFFGGVNLLKTISINTNSSIEEELMKYEIEYENKKSLSEYLGKINNNLYKMWQGAVEAYYGNNTDKIRHFSVSIRELFTHVLHILSPDNEIKKWSLAEAHYKEGRPTRKARLLYICRNISNNEFTEFVQKDIETALAFLNIFQQGTHKIESNLSQSDMATLKSKAESTLRFLLEIEFNYNFNK